MGKQIAGRGSVQRALAALGLAVALAAPAQAASGPAYVVKDLATGTEPGASSDPGPFFDLGHTTLLFAGDGSHGRELWRSDGTSAGTTLLKDIAAGPADGVGNVGHVADGVLYFPGAQGGLWRSDGTAGGTTKFADLKAWRLRADGNRLYVMVLVGYESVDLFRVDLPSGAQTLLGSYHGAQVEPSLTLVGGRLFFAADDRPEGLWTSDGTPEGTRLVRAVQLANSEGGNDNTEMIAVGGLVFFAAYDDAGWEVWRSDGTEAGTYRVRDISPGPRYGIHFNDYWEGAEPFFAVLGDVLVFMADDGVSGLEPWRSDGTEAGTVRIADVWPGPIGVDGTLGYDDNADYAGRTVRVVPFRGQVYFTARSGAGPLGLWRTEGTPETTQLVTAFDDTIGYLGAAVANATHIYVGGYDRLWVSDGTSAGSAPVATVDQISQLTPAFGGVIFRGRHDVAGFEPWVSDGTAAGTRFLADISRGLPGLGPEHLTDLGGVLIFSADDTAHGRELWRSDGTAAGTRMVADIIPGDTGSFPDGLVASGAAVYFTAGESYKDRALWRSDGTAAGTIHVGGPLDPLELAADGRGGVYFFSDEPSAGSFWHSDGTPAGTQLIRAGDAGVWLEALGPAVTLDGLTLFAVQSAEHGWAIWRTDGTVGGTALVTSFDDRSPRLLTQLGNAALFVVNDSGSDSLWRTDGTADGTVELVDVGSNVSGPIVAANGRLFFNSHYYLDYRLWQTDGTKAGTFAVVSAKYVKPTQVAPVADRLFTLASRARKTVFGEPGCVDLAETQTEISRFDSLREVGDRLVFAERLASNAQRLWTSDGTRSGTTELQALPAPSVGGPLYETRFVRSGQRVFFAARQGDVGSELWALPLSALPPVASAPCEMPPTPTPIPARPTPTPFECPNGSPRCTVLEIEPAKGRAGERVTILVVLHASDLPIAGVQNDITMPPGIAVAGNDDDRPACTVEPSIDKNSSAFSFQPSQCQTSGACDSMRALVLDLFNTDPIYDGAVLYRCELQLSPDLEPGDYTLALSNLGASDPVGNAVPLEGIEGVITVLDQSGTRPIEQASGGSDGCQTAPPDGRAAAAICLVLGGLALVALRRQRRR